jgi:predicted RNase H-like nuclease (RuvC/YqgF family)
MTDERIYQLTAERDDYKKIAWELNDDCIRLRQQLAAKDAEIERLTRDRDYWQNIRALPAEAELATAERQRDTLKEALTAIQEKASGRYGGDGLLHYIHARATAALASLDQPADVAEGEKRD